MEQNFQNQYARHCKTNDMYRVCCEHVCKWTLKYLIFWNKNDFSMNKCAFIVWYITLRSRTISFWTLCLPRSVGNGASSRKLHKEELPILLLNTLPIAAYALLWQINMSTDSNLNLQIPTWRWRAHSQIGVSCVQKMCSKWELRPVGCIWSTPLSNGWCIMLVQGIFHWQNTCPLATQSTGIWFSVTLIWSFVLSELILNGLHSNKSALNLNKILL